MTHIGGVPEGAAAEEAERLLMDPPVVRARKRWNEIAACKLKHLDGVRCSSCGASPLEVRLQRSYEMEDDLRRADGLPD